MGERPVAEKSRGRGVIYPEDFEQRIGFDKIRGAVSLLCATRAARELVESAGFMTDTKALDRVLKEVAEMRDVLTLEGGYPGGGYLDMNRYLHRVRVEGTYLEMEQMVELLKALVLLDEMTAFFRSKRAEGVDPYPLLSERADRVGDFGGIRREIVRVIDPESGRVKDNASTELARLRRLWRERNALVNKRLQAILKQAQAAGLVDSDSEISMRDGRTVIPVVAANKRKIKGLVHDESATGKTAYIEPMEVVELNNELREIENQERREVIRILTAFADLLRPELAELLDAGEYLVQMDFVQAKARYALGMDAVMPQMTEQAGVYLKQARHPLLQEALKKEGKPIVPLDLILTREKHILLISGPNAGGKSVCLKTAGLLQYMFQCGWLVPADADSKMGIFRSLFIDIGDQQSLDNDLSTYSSHLINMKQILRSADADSLVLIDEFGSGTEPGMGGAIAESVLQQLEARRVWSVITTHYANLKYYAAGAQGIENGAMAFDIQNIKPLFRLEMGRPGSSFAFEIARKIGLPEDIIRAAETKIGSSQANAEKHIREAARDKRYWENKRERIRQIEKGVDRTAGQYEQQLLEIQAEKNKIISAAKSEAAELLSEANRQIEKTIREIRESEAERNKTKSARADFDQFRNTLDGSGEMAVQENAEQGHEEKIERKIRQLREREQRRREKRDSVTENKTEGQLQSEKSKKPKELEVGLYVRIRGQQIVGEVVALPKGNKATVVFGQITTSVDKIRLEIVPRAEYRRTQKIETFSSPIVSKDSYDTSKKRLNFKQQLDIRGVRAEEALQQVQVFVDEAIMLSIQQVTILHGKGTGALRLEVRRYLETIPLVLSATDEDEKFGGAGITVVLLDV